MEIFVLHNHTEILPPHNWIMACMAKFYGTAYDLENVCFGNAFY